MGFQSLALAYGAPVLRAAEPVHGRLSAIAHTSHPLFSNIPSGEDYQVVRYHSLIVEETSLPPVLEPIAWTTGGGHHALGIAAAAVEPLAPTTSNGLGNGSLAPGNANVGTSGVLMGITHRSLPYYGVQYHPESIGTTYGTELLQNFKDLTVAYYQEKSVGRTRCMVNGNSTMPLTVPLPFKVETSRRASQEYIRINNNNSYSYSNGFSTAINSSTPSSLLSIVYKEIPSVLERLPNGAQTLFEAVVLKGAQAGDSCTTSTNSNTVLEDTFWLDTAAVDRGRFSFMGARGGRLWRRITYCLPVQHCTASGGGTVTSIDADGHSTKLETPFWDWLDEQLTTLRLSPQAEKSAAAAALPFEFWGGLIGYLGYELKAECGGKAVHVAGTPDAAFFLVDQFLGIDHKTGSVYVVAVHDDGDRDGASNGNGLTGMAGETLQSAQKWVDDTAALVERLLTPKSVCAATNGVANGGGKKPNGVHSTATVVDIKDNFKPSSRAPFVLRESREQYLDNVNACMEALFAGDSYELCLTTEMRRACSWENSDAWRLYKILRRVNPAPYAAWMQFGGEKRTGEDNTEIARLANGSVGSCHRSSSSALTICCSSPERFLKGDLKGALEAKPIKGTAPRRAGATADEDVLAAAALATSEKDRAENLMIVDLLRNDLGRVCDPGTVHVPALMQVESFTTVHQLVSTVRGQRGGGASVADAVRAAFPGGSMTGAPKVRSMAILDSLEKGPRGVYSGSLGYFSFNSAFDLNIVIRTAVVHDGDVSIGAGGAIVVQSDDVGEYEEMRLKASALLRAVAECDGCIGAVSAKVLD